MDGWFRRLFINTLFAPKCSRRDLQKDLQKVTVHLCLLHQLCVGNLCLFLVRNKLYYKFRWPMTDRGGQECADPITAKYNCNMKPFSLTEKHTRHYMIPNQRVCITDCRSPLSQCFSRSVYLHVWNFQLYSTLMRMKTQRHYNHLHLFRLAPAQLIVAPSTNKQTSSERANFMDWRHAIYSKLWFILLFIDLFCSIFMQYKRV